MDRGRLKFLAHVSDGLRQAIDAHDVVLVEAEADETRIILASGPAVRDVRSIAETEAILSSEANFLRVHRSYLVNLDHLHQVRRRNQGRDWECVMSTDGGAVVPVSRDRYSALLERFRG